MTLPYGLEIKVPERDKCPSCGAPAVDTSPEGDEIYKCGSVYPSKGDLRAPGYCVQHSHVVQRRLSTICGILDACDPEERQILLTMLFIKYKE